MRKGLKAVRHEPGHELGDGVSIPGRGNSKYNFAEAGVCLESSRKSKDLRLESHLDSCGPGVLEFSQRICWSCSLARAVRAPGSAQTRNIAKI